jgi:two-component system, sensor histidine kinase and response regulator
LRILVVDDNEDIRRICGINLRFLGHVVIEASGGEELLTLVSCETPDLVVLDAMMPGMDGLAVLAELQIRPETADIPVILLSARVLLEDQLAGLEAGAVAYVTKPFVPIDLARAIERVQSMGREERAELRERTIDFLEELHGPKGGQTAGSRA